ncbi:MAG: metallophosphoesterase family protein [Planctomycetota bacterium]|nr:metallophosphoesterase family protein [Planctomycetota bacterium]
MTGGDWTRLLLFTSAVGAVGVLSVAITVKWLRRRLGRRPAPARTAAGRWSRRGVLSLAGMGVGGLTWAKFVEPYWIETVRVPIRSDKIASDSIPVRLVHISDLHCDARVRAEDSLIALVGKCSPDLIVFTGDCVNEIKGLVHFRRCMKALAGIAPTFAVKGNCDAGTGIVDYFVDTGVRELRGQWHTLNIAGSKLHVGGLPVEEEHRLDETLAATPRDGFRLFLYHYPDEIYRVAAAGVDLHCAGHTHGGQVALPWFGAIVTLSKFGKRFEHGLYQVDNTHLYVTRGIGMEGGPAPRIRLFARPEVTCIELSPQPPS